MLTSTCSVKSLSDASARGAGLKIPAEVTTMSTPPNSDSARSNSAATCPASATSARIATALPPASLTLVTISRAASADAT